VYKRCAKLGALVVLRKILDPLAGRGTTLMIVWGDVEKILNGAQVHSLSLPSSSPLFLLLQLHYSLSPFHLIHAHVISRVEPPKPATLDFLLRDSDAIRLLGSARRM
jgi:hypothetical protein